MSQEIREKALSAAVAVAASQGVAEVIAAAGKFEAYIMGAIGAGAPATKPTPATKPVVEKAKPVATKPVEKAKPVAAKPDPDLKKVVGDKVNELLKANLRDEAIALLASFDGAQSASGVVSQGQEAAESFLAQADELLSAQPTEAMAD